eukprot:5083433-Amphidinium_carterae.2
MQCACMRHVVCGGSLPMRAGSQKGDVGPLLLVQGPIQQVDVMDMSFAAWFLFPTCSPRTRCLPMNGAYHHSIEAGHRQASSSSVVRREGLATKLVTLALSLLLALSELL